MADQMSSLTVFVDYDNLMPSQKSVGILNVVTKALMQVPLTLGGLRTRCEVRVYGGWYEGASITHLAQDITVELHRDFPAIIRLPNSIGDVTTVTTTAELAVALLQEPGHHMFNTYRRKGKPCNIRVESPTTVGCADPDCILPLVKKLLKTGRCSKLGCSVTAPELVYRHEQKIVDTMLACDLIYAADGGAQRVILISGDDDFLPPLRAVTLRGATAVRFHTRPNSQRTSFPHGGGKLIEMEL